MPRWPRPPTPRTATRSPPRAPLWRRARSEEHTSELQSRQYLVCRLLLEKKNLLDAGTIREAKDLAVRQLYNIAGEGSVHHAMAARRLQAQIVDTLKDE